MWREQAQSAKGSLEPLAALRVSREKAEASRLELEGKDKELETLQANIATLEAQLEEAAVKLHTADSQLEALRGEYDIANQTEGERVVALDARIAHLVTSEANLRRELEAAQPPRARCRVLRRGRQL